MSRRLDPPRLSYAYYLLISADAAHCQAYRDVSRFLWSIYGSEAIRSQPPRPHRALATDVRTGGVRPDHHTGMRVHTGRSSSARAGLPGQYESTGNRAHLARGFEALDQACLLQSVWRIPWRRGPCRTGHGCRIEQGLVSGPGARGPVRPLRDALRRPDRRPLLLRARHGGLKAALAARALDEASQAAVNDCAESIRAEYGSVYVHVGKRWGACASGTMIRRLDFGKGEVRLDFIPHPNGENHRRIVFGGLRGKTYKVRIRRPPAAFARGSRWRRG